MDPPASINSVSSASSIGSGGSRLPRFTPVRPAISIASAVTLAGLMRKAEEFKQPKNRSVQALTLAIKKRYSTGRKGPVARSSPSAPRAGVVKRLVPASTSLGKRPARDNAVVVPKKTRILGESNRNVLARRPITATPSENSRATTLKKTGPRKLVNDIKSQENCDAIAGPGTSNQTQAKRKVQPWDLRGKLELANETIQKLKEELQAQSNRVKELEDLGGSSEDTISNLTRQLAGEKAVSANRLREIDDRNDQIGRLENDIRKRQDESDALKRTHATEKFELNAHIAELKKKVEELEDELEKYQRRCEEQASEIDRLHDLRKHLHNQVQDLKGNIRVLCRVRPPTPKEATASSPLCHIEYNDLTSLELYKMKDGTSVKQKKVACNFSFDRVFPASSSQEEVYNELEQLVQSCLDGYNVCVFAYGQTGSGKTYTMDGDESPSQRGMIPRTVATIFNKIETLRQLGWEYNVEVFFVEIYNEQIHDLLNYNSGLSHEIRMVPNKKNEIFVTNLRVEPVYSQGDLNNLMALARNNRFVASTVCNSHSSRSHFIMKIAVNGSNSKRQLSCSGSISLVDLAGSERYEDNNSSDRRRETMSINKSLSSLANVIMALKQKNDHVPYRVSKLTHLLMPSLGGSSKTLMIVNISPLKDCYLESVNSLRFANCVNQCHIVAKKNERTTATL